MSIAQARPWSALWFLYSRSWRNRVAQQLRRLKQPRYILGALAMGAYFGSLLFSQSARSAVTTDPGLLDIRHLLSIVGLAIALGAWWLAAPSDNALAFSPAEVYFLFPAPVKRRTLVQARLFSVQAILLAQVIIWTLLLRRSDGDLNGVLRAIGLWVLFTTISLHRLGATLARTHAPDAPRRKPVARTIAILFLVTLALAVAHAAPPALAVWQSMGDSAGPEAARVLDKLIVGRTAIQTLLDDPVVNVLLWPIRSITTPAFASGTRAWLLAMPGAVALLLLHYVWILRDPQPFEELAIGSSARFADRVARMRRGGSLAQAQPTRFRWELGLEGHPAVALAWKNVTAVIRTFRPRSLLITTLLVVIIAWFSTSGENEPGADSTLRSAFVTTLLSVLTGAVLTAPAWFRLDLRHDLTHLPFLKTAPIPAHTIVATEILTATAVTTTVMALLFGLPAFFLLRDVGGPLDNVGLAWAIVASVIALGGVNLLHITLYNAVALWLPAWVPLNAGGAATGGAAVVGQVYITLIGIILSLGVLLAVPAGAAYGLLRLLSPTSLPLPVTFTLMLAVALALVIAEWLGLARLLGRALDRLEPSDIPAVQG